MKRSWTDPLDYAPGDPQDAHWQRPIHIRRDALRDEIQDMAMMAVLGLVSAGTIVALIWAMPRLCRLADAAIGPLLS